MGGRRPRIRCCRPARMPGPPPTLTPAARVVRPPPGTPSGHDRARRREGGRTRRMHVVNPIASGWSVGHETAPVSSAPDRPESGAFADVLGAVMKASTTTQAAPAPAPDRTGVIEHLSGLTVAANPTAPTVAADLSALA